MELNGPELNSIHSIDPWLSVSWDSNLGHLMLLLPKLTYRKMSHMRMQCLLHVNDSIITAHKECFMKIDFFKSTFKFDIRYK